MDRIFRMLVFLLLLLLKQSQGLRRQLNELEPGTVVHTKGLFNDFRQPSLGKSTSRTAEALRTLLSVLPPSNKER